jgi:hypothetical protein
MPDAKAQQTSSAGHAQAEAALAIVRARALPIDMRP